jgi:hypothetical protein
MSPEFEKLHRLLGDAKCSLLLDKSRKRIKHTISNEEYHNLDSNTIEKIVKSEMVRKLSDGVVSDVYNKIEKQDLINSKSYELDVVVIPTSDLKSVVDYLVQNMALEDLLRIRSYGKEDKPFNL